MIGAVALPALVCALVLAVDFASAVSAREGLQKAADAGALAGARELMMVSGAQGEVAVAAAEALARESARGLPINGDTLDVTASFDPGDRTVRVALTADASTIFAEVIAGAPSVGAHAAALPVGDRSLCVLGLAETGVAVQGSSRGSIAANGCLVHANSTAPASLTLTQRATVAAESVCTSGGYRGRADAVNPAPTRDCPQIEDPLESRIRPDAKGCDHANRTLLHGSARWRPGVYCGGMTVSNGAKLELDPGVYVLKGGALALDNGAKLFGKGVTFYLTLGARLNVQHNSTIELSAPANGTTAGLLFFGDPRTPAVTPHLFMSHNAPLLLGTVYLPNATLRIGGANAIADQSPWTALVVGRLSVEGQAQVVLNSRYDDTDVPLPQGLQSATRNIRLTQ